MRKLPYKLDAGEREKVRIGQKSFKKREKSAKKVLTKGGIRGIILLAPRKKPTTVGFKKAQGGP